MLDHARLAVEFTSEVTFATYTGERVRQLALERVIEIIGEAAHRVSQQFREAHPEIPWRKIIANRNLLAHEYDEIRHERLWQTAVEDVPNLIEILEPLIPPLPLPEDEELQ